MALDTLAALMIRIILMVAFGYFLKKKGIMDDTLQSSLSNMLVKAILPLSILATGNYENPGDLGNNLLLCALVAVIYYVVSIPLVWLITKPLGLPHEKRGPFITMSVFANTAFIGFPIANALFGAEGMLYTVIYNLAFQAFLFTVGILFLGNKKDISLRAIISNPLTICSVASILLFASPIRLPELLVGTMKQIGDMSVPISMIIIGGNLASMRFKDLWTDKHSYLVSLIRLLIIPLATLGLLALTPLRGTLPAVCVTIAALPAATLNVILAEQYKADVHFTASTVLQNMVLMVVLLPLLLQLASFVFF